MKTCLAVLIAALAILPSCGSSTEPAKEAVQLSFASDHAAGSPANPITFTVKVSNLGFQPAWHYEGCSAGIGVKVHYYDADGNLLQTSDPYAPQPACADGLVPLDPGKKLETGSRFDGTLYSFDPDPADRHYPAPAGRYRALATFGYFWDPEQRHDKVLLSESIEFDWSP